METQTEIELYVIYYEDRDKVAGHVAKYGEDGQIDPADTESMVNARDLTEAHALMTALRASGHGMVRLLERRGIVSYPYEDGSGLLHWEWDEELVED